MRIYTGDVGKRLGTYRADEELLAAVAVKAAERGETVTDVIIQRFRAYIRDDEAPRTLAAIRPARLTLTLECAGSVMPTSGDPRHNPRRGHGQCLALPPPRDRDVGPLADAHRVGLPGRQVGIGQVAAVASLPAVPRIPVNVPRSRHRRFLSPGLIRGGPTAAPERVSSYSPHPQQG